MKKVMILILIVILLFGMTIVVGATVIPPGSEGDPVVTKSYVDSQIALLKGSGVSSDSYKAVQLTSGQELIGNEGTEIILRSGEAKALDNGANGVSDITGAKDLMTGHWVAQNHLLLIPRSDGRGIVAITDIWVMVRGAYTIR